MYESKAEGVEVMDRVGVKQIFIDFVNDICDPSSADLGDYIDRIEALLQAEKDELFREIESKRGDPSWGLKLTTSDWKALKQKHGVK